MREGTREKQLFESSPVLEAIMRLALPAVFGQIIMVIYNMADTFFVGLTGSDAMITAVTVCMPAFMILSAIANLFGVGGASVISRALGRQDRDSARSASAFALWGCVAVTLLYSLIALCMLDTFVDLLGGSSSEVHVLAREYLLCTVILGGVMSSLNNLLAHLLRAEGRSVQASLGIVLGGVLNMALDPLFMFVLLPAGREALGAAVATALSNAFATLYFALVLMKARHETVLRFDPTRRMFAGGIPGDILSAGAPACLMTLCENISFAVMDNLMVLAGTAAQAGIGVAKKVNMLAHCIARGMAQGVLPLIGYNYASGDHRRMRAIVTASASLSVAMAALCMLACLFFDESLVGVFIVGETESLAYGARFLRVLCIGGPFSACAYAFISFFQATGHGRRSLLLALLRKGVLDIPLMFLILRISGVADIPWATPIADIVCCGVSIAMMVCFFRSHADLSLPQNTPVAQ